MNGYLGIDVSKGYADFALLSPERKLLEEVFQFDDTRDGHDGLRAQLKSLIEKNGITHLYCGLESTGGFENNWYGSLIQWKENLPLSVARLNPLGVKKNSEASLKRNVTDALSSQYIAEYLISHSQTVNYNVQNSTYSSYRSLHKHIFLQKKQSTQLINQLKSVLYSAFPELMRYCKDSVPAWVLKVLVKYPSAWRVARVKPEQLIKINHVDNEKASLLISKAKCSVAFQRSETTEFLVQTLASQILEKQRYIEESKAVLEQNCKGPEVALLTTIVGVGDYSAAAIMIEIENIKRFPTAKDLVSYFGLHPELKESGDKKMIARMSKKGRASMRAVLYMCAKTAVIYDSHMKAIYHKHRSKGKGHNQALGVIMQKLLRIVWGMLNTSTKYDSAVDQKKQIERSGENNMIAGKEFKSKRRFQELDESAPISKRQTNKRKVYAESQASDLRSNTGSSTHT
jgi:transposase